jgi:hypothetical protein
MIGIATSHGPLFKDHYDTCLESLVTILKTEKRGPIVIAGIELNLNRL